MPARDEMPSTIARSPERAKEIWSKAHDSAVESYGEGERSHRTAFSALKHEFEKVGDHWEPKDKPGPSDRRAEEGPESSEPTAQGVDANASKGHLYKRAQELDIDGRSKMSKDELVKALAKANEAATRKARGK